MPDGVIPSETTAPELVAETADSRLVRHVRRNLVPWSGGRTLVLLLMPARPLRRGRGGTALRPLRVRAPAPSGAGPGSLANTATAQLDTRFDQVQSILT